MAEPAEALIALAIAAAPSLVSFCGQTTAPAWRGQPKVLYRPTCEAYAPSPSDTDPSCREVAELAMKLFDMSPLELLQEASDRLLAVSPRTPTELTLRLAAEGLRRLLDTVDPLVPQPPGSSRFTRNEMNGVARTLFAQAGLKEPPRRDDDDDDGGGGEVLSSSKTSNGSSATRSDGAAASQRLSPRDATVRNLEARPLPPWLVAPLWCGMVSGRAGLVFGLGLHSVTVNLGPHLGDMHYFDSHPGGLKGTRGAALSATTPPLLLCHGMFTNGLSMGLLAAALSDLGRFGGGERRVIVPDLLGSDFGCSRTDKAQAQPLNVAAHTRSLVALLDKIGLGTIDLLGHSFGGFLVQELAATLPAWRVRKLVLLCPGGGNRYRPGLSLRTVWGPDFSSEVFHKLPTGLRELAANIFQAVAHTETQAHLLMEFFDASNYFFRFRDLSHLPALLLWGTDDNIIEPRCSKVQFAHLRHPHSYGYWLHNASHALNFDTLPEVYTLTSAFLDDCNHGTNVSGNECSGKQAKGGWFAEALLAALPSRHVVRMLPEVDNDAGDNNHMKHERRLPQSRL